MTRVYYLHTINGRPAHWDDDCQQIMVGDVSRRPRGAARPVQMRSSVQEIRRDQRRSRANQRKWGWDLSDARYGYSRVEVPA